MTTKETTSPVRRYSPSALRFLGRDDGLPSGQVHAMAQGHDGVFWFSTPSGLARYDGSRFNTYSKADGLSSHGLRGLAFSRLGSLWVGSDVGLDLVGSDARVADSGPGVEWNYGLVERIVFGSSGAWVGTANGLYGRSRGRWHRESDSLVYNHPIRAICESERGQLYVAVGGVGLVYRGRDRWHLAADLESHALGEIRALTVGPRGSILVGGMHGFVLINDSGQPIGAAQPDHGTDPVTAALYHNNQLWIGSGGELRIYKLLDGVWVVTDIVAANLTINQLHADQFGNVWAATESDGVLRVSALAEVIRPVQLSATHPVFAIRLADNGDLLIGGDKGSDRLLGSVGSPPSEPVSQPIGQPTVEQIAALEKEQVWDLLEDKQRRLWAATSAGLLRFSPGKDNDYGNYERLGGDHPVLSAANRVLLQRREEIWIGTLNGCAAVDLEDAIRSIEPDGGQPMGYVYTLTEDGSSCLWIGTLGNGLWRETDGGLVRQSGEGLIDTGNTYAIAVRGDGLMAVSQDNRLVLISPDGDARVLITTDDPIAAWSLCWAAGDELWAGSASGLAQYNPNDGRRLRQLTAMLGLAGWEFTTSRSLYAAADNRFYCGLNSGLVEINTDALARVHSPPETHLRQLQWINARPQLSDNAYSIESGNWTLVTEVFSAWYLDEQDLHFRYRLVGFDEDWSVLTRQAEVRYSSLPPGDYRLEAQAFNRLVGFGPVADLFELAVVAPGWVRSKLVAPLRGFAALVAMKRNKSLRRQEIALERLVEERTTALELTNAKLSDANAALADLSYNDALTGIFNRRYFDQLMINEMGHAARAGQPLSLLLLDIDYFKLYNDLFGHATGDRCLVEVAETIQHALKRGADSFCRYGGEEFAVVLPSTGRRGAEAVAELLRKAVADQALEHPARPEPLILTISVGVATWQSEDRGITPEHMIASADTALYAAKDRGRNRVQFEAVIGRS